MTGLIHSHATMPDPDPESDALRTARSAIDAVLAQDAPFGQILAEMMELRDYVNEQCETLADQLAE